VDGGGVGFGTGNSRGRLQVLQLVLICGITGLDERIGDIAVTVTTETTTSDMTLETKDDLEKITIALNQAVLDPPIHSPPPAAFGAGGPM
jgi:hypothetical protein